jgi:hypothetical protein
MRETNLLGGVLLVPRGRPLRLWALAAGTVLAFVPLWLWQDYLFSLYRLRALTGGDHVTTPLLGYSGELRDAWLVLSRADWRSPERYSLCAVIALTVQLVWLLWRRDWADPWWRLGIVTGLLLLVLHPVVWAGSPGAVTRVALPMTAAFHIGLVRRPAHFWWWFVPGSLTVLPGLDMLHVPLLGGWF